MMQFKISATGKVSTSINGKFLDCILIMIGQTVGI